MNAFERFGYYAAQYLDDVSHSHKSKQTVANYTKVLRLFMEYWKNNWSIEEEPKSAMFRAWRNHLDEKGLKPSTVKAYLLAMHVFYSYFEDEEDDDGNLVFDGRNPVSKKLYPKQEKRPYDMILTNEEIAMLWKNVPPTCKQKAMWPRNYALCVLLIDSKIRNAECLDLKLSDVDLDEGFLVVRKGKGNKTREVTIDPITVSAIKLYLASGIRPSSLSDDDYLFGTTADSTGLTHQEEWHRGTSAWLSSLIERHVKSVTGIANVRSHDLRHVGARLNLSTGVSIEALESEMGHSSPVVTELYAGKLQTRKSKREEARNALRIRDEWAIRNMAMLAKT